MPKIAKRSVGRPRRHVAPDQIEELRKQGFSFREIARKTGVGYGTVRRAYRSNGILSDASQASGTAFRGTTRIPETEQRVEVEG
jgi:DNA invertase Pin-like site-specific DNA recombinase